MLRLRSLFFTAAALLLASGTVAVSPMTLAAPRAPKAKARREAETVSKGFLTKTIKQGAEEYKYVVYVPADYDGSKAYPTIVFLNGAGECGRDGWKHVATGLGPAIMKDATKWPFLVVFPQKPTARSNWEDHDALVMAMLDQTKADYKVDTTRLYLTGLSQGGHGTWMIGAKHPEMFAALAPVCGWSDVATATTLKPLPIWCFHGEADPTVKVEKSHEMVDAVKAAGGDVKLTTYPGVGHNSWDNAYGKEDLGAWFLQHTKK